MHTIFDLMNTQVIFNIDNKLKQAAAKKAKAEGIPLAAVLKLALKAYVDGDLTIGAHMAPKFNAATRKLMDEAIREAKSGKNSSPIFDNVADAIAYLNS